MSQQVIEWQTCQIVQSLIDGPSDSCSACCIESDGPSDGDDNFDPAPIANRLRQIAETLQRDMEFQAALRDLTNMRPLEEPAVDAIFSRCVTNLCQAATHTVKEAPEVHLIRTAAALCLYVTTHAAELRPNIQRATAAFLNTRVGGWVAMQGGWGGVEGI